MNGILANRLSTVRRRRAPTHHPHDPPSPNVRQKVSLSADEAPLLQATGIEAAAGPWDALKRAGMQITGLSAAGQTRLLT